MTEKNKIFWYPFQLSAEADNFIVSEIAKSSSQDFSETLLLTTSLRRSRRLERLFVKKIKEERSIITISPPLFTTLDAFAEKIFQQAVPLGHILSEEEQNYLILQLLKGKQRKKDYWKVVYAYRSLIKELKNYFLGGRKEMNKKIENFFVREKDASRLDYSFLEDASLRINRALEVFDSYQSFLKERGLYDLEDAFLITAKNLSAESFPYKSLWIDNFYDFTPLSWLLIEKIIKLANEVVVISGWENTPSDNPLYLLTHQTFLAFEKILKASRRALFVDLKPKKNQAFFQSAKNRYEEVKQIARKICYLAREKRFKLNEIMVTFPDPLPYLPHLNTLFSRYQIPYNLSHGFPLKRSPVVKLVVDLVRCVNEDYPRRLVVDLLRSPFVKLVSGEIGLFIDWKSRQNGVIKGKGTWQESFKETAFFNEERLKVKDAKKALKKLVSQLEVFEKKASLGEFNKNLFKVLKEFGFFEALKSLSRKDKSELKAWQALAERLKRVNSFAEGFFSGEISLSEYVEILKMIVEKGRYWLEGEETLGVQVVGVLEARGMGYRCLFFGGLTDEDYPGKATKELFFSEKLKSELGLPLFTHLFALFRYNFKRLIVSSEVAYLSYPQAEGREVFLRSRFLDDLNLEGVGWFVPENILLAPFEAQKHLPQLADLSFLKGLVSSKAFELIKKRQERQFELNDKKEKERIELKDYIPPLELSVTDLEKYNLCGFLFLYEVVLKLRLLKEPEEEIQPAFWGKLVHDFLASSLREEVLTLGQEGLEKHLKEKALEWFDLNLNSGYGLMKNWLLEAVIEKLAPLEVRRFSQGFKPLSFEVPVEFLLGGLKLKGRIDRVDSFKGNGLFLIDYKTKQSLGGSKISNVKRMFSRDLQLFLYALGLQKKVLGVGYYVLHEACVELDDYLSSELAQSLGCSNRGKPFEKYLEEKIDKAEKITKKIRQGVFEKNQSYCFSCRYQRFC